MAKGMSSYPALDVACHDIVVFIVWNAAVGAVIMTGSALMAIWVTGILGSTIVLVFFPLASVLTLWQHLVSLRMKRVEYLGADAERRRGIEQEVRDYQKMMLEGGLTSQVAGLIAILRRAEPSAEKA